MKKPAKAEKGFTLIELSLILGIIGLLSAMAIPAFMNYQAKTKQSEAKVNLAGVFSTETAYFAEKNHYGYGLQAVGFALAGKPVYYDFTLETPDAGGAWNDDAWSGANGIPGNGPPEGAILNFVDNIKPGVSERSFTALAAGNIDGDNDYDTWTINSGRILKNQWNDIED